MNDLFASLSDATPSPALHDRLVDEAERDSLLDVAYRTLDTPVGTLLLAATPVGLVRVAYDVEDHDAVLAALADRVSPRVLRAPARLDVTALDRRLSSGFRAEVLAHLPEIGYGHTESYTQVAAAAGNAKAVRAVGTACATNPLPVVVPCHRVVRADGSWGGYVGGPEAKRALLTLEGVGGL